MMQTLHLFQTRSHLKNTNIPQSWKEGDDMFADYHVHTAYSDDSTTPMEEQVKAAVSMGLKEVCFTDHVDYGIKKDWSEGEIRYRESGGALLANVDYPNYFEELGQLKKKYEGQIEIRKGLEFGIQTSTIAHYDRLFSDYAEELDFILLSIHQIDNKELWTQVYQRGKSQQEYNEGYYHELLEVMKRFKHYSVLAHLDLVVRYDKQGVYPFENIRNIVAEILKLCISDGKGIEVNTSSWRYGLKDTQPSRDILELYKDLGGEIITIGSDAHTTGYLANHVKEAEKILRELGFRYIYTFEHRNPMAHRI